MPLTLQKLTGSTVEADIRVKMPGGGDEGEPMHLVYLPGVLTPALENDFRIYGERSEGWAALLQKLVASWDLQDADGETVPLEYIPERRGMVKEAGPNGQEREVEKVIAPAAGALMALPAWFLQAVVAGIRENLRPNPRTAETSGGSS